jgi:DNA-binding LacI/PurR family transcriptional regulator
MANEKVTSLDVARKAGVSQSAVSRVLTPGASASKKTVEKVRSAVTELGYRPNILARSLITGKSRIIGLVVAYLNNRFYPEVLEKLSHRLQRKGYHVLIFIANNTQDDISQVIEGILEYQVDGIVAASVAMSSDLAARCQAAGVPIVLFNRSQDDDALCSVTSNNFLGGQTAARHLLDLGHTKIGYIAGWEGASTQLEREDGFNSELALSNLKVSHREVGNFEIDEAKQAALKMFGASNYPTAVFVASDHMAFAVMDILRSNLGFRIPQDVSVVGFDDVSLASYSAYDLTTIRQPLIQMVDTTVDILLTQIEHPETVNNRVIKIDPVLIKRSSSSVEKEK